MHLDTRNYELANWPADFFLIELYANRVTIYEFGDIRFAVESCQ